MLLMKLKNNLVNNNTTVIETVRNCNQAYQLDLRNLSL